jgi:hypothetical protein
MLVPGIVYDFHRRRGGGVRRRRRGRGTLYL